MVLRHHEVVQPGGVGCADQVSGRPGRGGGGARFQAWRGNPQAGAEVPQQVLGPEVARRRPGGPVSGGIEDHVQVSPHDEESAPAQGGGQERDTGVEDVLVLAECAAWVEAHGGALGG